MPDPEDTILDLAPLGPVTPSPDINLYDVTLGGIGEHAGVLALRVAADSHQAAEDLVDASIVSKGFDPPLTVSHVHRVCLECEARDERARERGVVAGECIDCVAGSMEFELFNISLDRAHARTVTLVSGIQALVGNIDPDRRFVIPRLSLELMNSLRENDGFDEIVIVGEFVKSIRGDAVSYTHLTLPTTPYV